MQLRYNSAHEEKTRTQNPNEFPAIRNRARSTAAAGRSHRHRARGRARTGHPRAGVPADRQAAGGAFISGRSAASEAEAGGETMSVNQRTHRGRTDWYYQIEVNGRRIRRHGFETKRAAIAAEAVARARETKKHGLAHPSDPPPTLDVLLENFFALHCAGADPLSPKTAARYREQKPYLAQALLETAPEEITRARWSEEWARLLAAGGHTRGLQTPRPLSRKSVRNIA